MCRDKFTSFIRGGGEEFQWGYRGKDSALLYCPPPGPPLVTLEGEERKKGGDVLRLATCECGKFEFIPVRQEILLL